LDSESGSADLIESGSAVWNGITPKRSRTQHNG